MSDELIKPLQACISLLDKFEPQLPDAASDEMSARAILTYSRAIPFGRTTLEVMIETLRTERFAVTCPTIVRPYFELSARICWASNDRGRWRRLWRYWLGEMKRALEASIEIQPDNNSAIRQLRICDEQLSALLKSKDEAEYPPKLWKMLRQINVFEGPQSNDDKNIWMAKSLYATFYGTACDTAHGNVIGIEYSLEFLSNISVLNGAVMGTYFLLRELPRWLFEENVAVEQARSEIERSFRKIWNSVPVPQEKGNTP